MTSECPWTEKQTVAQEDTLRLQIEDLKERERAARLTEHDAYMNAQDKIAASHAHEQVRPADSA